MTEIHPHPQAVEGPAKQRQMALSRWDSDGGAGVLGPQEDLVLGTLPPSGPDLVDSELTQLRFRVIALENLVMALLAAGSQHQVELAREVTAYIAPRPGMTPHPLTLRAARQMDHLLQQAAHFRTITQP